MGVVTMDDENMKKQPIPKPGDLAVSLGCFMLMKSSHGYHYQTPDSQIKNITLRKNQILAVLAVESSDDKHSKFYVKVLTSPEGHIGWLYDIEIEIMQ